MCGKRVIALPSSTSVTYLTPMEAQPPCDNIGALVDEAEMGPEGEFLEEAEESEEELPESEPSSESDGGDGQKDMV